MSTTDNPAERLAAIAARLRHHAEQAEAEIAAANDIVRNLGGTGLVRGHVVLGRCFERPYVVEQHCTDSGQVIQAALLVPEGFGVCYWDTEEFCALHESFGGLEPEARARFQPFDSCTDEEKTFLRPFVEEMLDDLHDVALAAAARLEPGPSVSLEEYFRDEGNDEAPAT
ncbi:MAG TPA: hypothetical protein VHZ24_06650 [Pirellulales bacterium]|jgi:hypothetical protein|nr:hypothetical protein [Pirellulales bacterium]